MEGWSVLRGLDTQLRVLYCARYEHAVHISYVGKEEYGTPIYILGVTGHQDLPAFSGEKKLGWHDSDASGVEFCSSLGMFSDPPGGFAKLTSAVNNLGEMLPASNFGQVGWNVVGSSCVG